MSASAPIASSDWALPWSEAAAVVSEDALALDAPQAWAFLPCGLLYSALLVAALSPGLWQGGLVMALFALGSSLSLWAGPCLWRRLGKEGANRSARRLAGALLLTTSVWALWMALAHDQAPWCISPV